MCHRLSFCLFSGCDSVTKQASSVGYVKILGSCDGMSLQWLSYMLDIWANFFLHQKERFLFFFLSVTAGSGTHPVGTGGLDNGGITYPSPPPPLYSGQFKNACNYTYTPKYAFMVRKENCSFRLAGHTISDSINNQLHFIRIRKIMISFLREFWL